MFRSARQSISSPKVRKRASSAETATSVSSLASTDGSPSKGILLKELPVIEATQVGMGIKSRAQTAQWVTLKEGYLFKTKRVKKSFHAVKSTKLRFFVLKQEPNTKAAELEYYEGKVLKGVVNMAGAMIVPDKPGRFRVLVKQIRHKKEITREMELASEEDKIKDCMGWVVALQQASMSAECGLNNGMLFSKDLLAAAVRSMTSAKINRQSRHQSSRRGQRRRSSQIAAEGPASNRSSMRPISDVDTEDLTGLGTPQDRLRQAAEEGDELDGYAVDNARWAALRRGWERANLDEADEPDGEDCGELSDLEDDEDVRLMREMEEEEERRQEEERVAFLRSIGKLPANDGGSGEPEASAAGTYVSVEGTAAPLDRAHTEDHYSEDDDDWLKDMMEAEDEAARLEDQASSGEDDEVRLMREAEAAEERQQEEDRLAFLAAKAQKEQGGGGDVEEAEEVRLMREAEAEEDRRQEEERQAYLAAMAAKNGGNVELRRRPSVVDV